MWDEQLEFWGDLFVGTRLHVTGVTFETFLQNPLRAIAELEDGPAVRRWARSRSVSATKLAQMVSGPHTGPSDEARRQAGIEEHARHDVLVRRFMRV
ncbi:hypothetical protein [Azospirillum sp. SYSU D00513]|uniref:hypothetical protein n=1 Tax=Azospirillum sp. SYSU D00513 TaxID=2812561 RepID=UPI001A97C440|nr:hypothetical protein [Azospirillum sp. SYSU D00513]